MISAVLTTRQGLHKNKKAPFGALSYRPWDYKSSGFNPPCSTSFLAICCLLAFLAFIFALAFATCVCLPGTEVNREPLFFLGTLFSFFLGFLLGLLLGLLLGYFLLSLPLSLLLGYFLLSRLLLCGLLLCSLLLCGLLLCHDLTPLNGFKQRLIYNTNE